MISERIRWITVLLWTIIAIVIVVVTQPLTELEVSETGKRLIILGIFVGSMAIAILLSWLVRLCVSFTTLSQLRRICRTSGCSDDIYINMLISRIKNLRDHGHISSVDFESAWEEVGRKQAATLALGIRRNDQMIDATIEPCIAFAFKQHPDILLGSQRVKGVQAKSRVAAERFECDFLERELVGAVYASS